MPRLSVSALVPGTLEQVYEHVTAYPVNGPPDGNALEARYGKLQGQEGNTLMFLEDIGGGVTWQCVFDPPNQRFMRAVDSTWSDRTDRFETTERGTLWTITWDTKVRGLASYTKWLVFQLKDKRQVYRRLVLPVLTHFQGNNSPSAGPS